MRRCFPGILTITILFIYLGYMFGGHSCMCRCSQLLAHNCKDRKKSQDSFYCPPSIPFKHGLSLNLWLMFFQQGRSKQSTSNAPVSDLPEVGVTGKLGTSRLLCECGNPNPSPHGCAAITQPLSHLSSFIFIFVTYLCICACVHMHVYVFE